MKRYISFALALIMLLSFAACSAESSETEEDISALKAEIYDVPVLSVAGTDLTYEYYRYYYLFIQKELETETGSAEDSMIKEELIAKLKRDRAIENLLQAYSQSLTDEEKSECNSYVAMYVSAYGDSFETLLQSQMNMTLNVFTDTTVKEYEYNKLLTYLSEEENGALDFSDDALSEYMSQFLAGMHIIVTTDSRTDSEAKKLANDLYIIALLDEAFEPIRELYSLTQSLSAIRTSINEISDQIAQGGDTASLTATLATLTKQLSETSNAISEKVKNTDIAAVMENYIEKLAEYGKYVMEIITSGTTSDDAGYLAMLDGDTAVLVDKIQSDSLTTAGSALAAAASEITADQTYIWINDEYRNAVSAFAADMTKEDAEAIISAYNNDTELSTDDDIKSLNSAFKLYLSLFNESISAYDIYSTLCDIENACGANLTKLRNYALYAAVKEASAAAERLSQVTDDVASAIELEYPILSNVVVTFEQLCMNYSDDYEENSDTVFYFRESSLLEVLRDAIKDLEAGEMTGIVKSDSGYHILKLVNPDTEKFKETYAYEKLEDMIREEIPNVEVVTGDYFDSLDSTKVAEIEKELASIGATESSTATPTATEEEDDSNYVLIITLVIAATVGIVAVLTVLIIQSGKEGSSAVKKGKKKKTVTKK